MLVTELAMFDMQLRTETCGGFLRGLVGRLFGRRAATPAAVQTSLRLVAPLPAVTPVAADAPDEPDAPRTNVTAFPWRRHPLLLDRETADLSLPERRARIAAVRGMFNARSGDYAAARLAFSDAVREPAIDLAIVPGFWQLPRAGLTAAVLAYEDAGRLRDAAALSAEIAHRFRPRPVRPTRTPRAAASGD